MPSASRYLIHHFADLALVSFPVFGSIRVIDFLYREAMLPSGFVGSIQGCRIWLPVDC